MPDILHITDVHLMRDPEQRLLNVNTQQTLEQVLDLALDEGTPQLLVASGDIAHEPDSDVYARFLRTVRDRYAGPLLCTPGNHDLLAPMLAAALPMTPIRIGDWQIIALDSHGDDEPSAAVDEDRIEALWAALDAPHALVFTHHHLLAIDCPWLDRDRISHPLLHERLRQPSPVRALAFGHVHQVVDDRLGAIRLLGSPSTCFQFAPGSARFTLDDTAPGYRRIHLHADGSIVTLVCRTPPLPEPPRIGS